MSPVHQETKVVTDMQQGLPITIVADGQFSDSLKPLLAQLEMWLNFQALKSDWYGNEDIVLSFDFTLVRSLDEKMQQLKSAPGASVESWVVGSGFAYHYESSSLRTIAFIAVDDLVKGGTGIEQGIKTRLISVANKIGMLHGLVSLSE